MIKPFCKSGTERGSSLVEVLIATFIVGATAYYATTSVSQNMLAQKRVTSKDSIQVYEEAFRALVSKEIVRAAEGNPAVQNGDTGCFKGHTLQNTLIGIKMAGDTEIQAMNKGVSNPKEVVHKDGTDWEAAFSRCWQEKTWKLDLSKGHLHSCMQIKSTNRNTRGYAFAEVSFSLVNLKTGQPFTKCSQFKNVNVDNSTLKKGATPSLPSYCSNKWAKALPKCKVQPGAKTTILTSFAEPPETKENDYTGNPNRGFRMIYTLYTKAPTQTGWQYSKASGEMFLGVNSHEDYCATRYGGNAKGPGQASGNCTYVGADTKYEPKPNPEIDIAQDDMDKFFPQTKVNATKAPNRPVPATLRMALCVPWTAPTKETSKGTATNTEPAPV
jgi:type II secretory pathway pseudopilin PulG